MSAVIQLLILSAVPFLWHLVSQRTAKGFLEWIGFKKPPANVVRTGVALFLLLMAAAIVPYLYLYLNGKFQYSGFVYDSFRTSGWSWQTISVIVIWAVIQTSLSEEIFFRGFIAKRCVRWLGYRRGNLVQACVFGAIHLPGMLGQGIVAMLITFVLTGGIGYAMCWLMNQKADGSLLPGWFVHAGVNIVSSLIVCAFLL